MSVTESGRAQTHVLLRGSPHAKGQLVEATVPAALNTHPPVIPKEPTKHGTSGKRLALAKWLTAADNPLTARVLANRLWQHHFGRGIVATSNDFGEFGERPSHPELLDWLATEVVNGGWKLKRMHKLILLSATYQQSAFAAQSLADAKSQISDLKSQISNPRSPDPQSEISKLKSEISNLKSADPQTADPSNQLLWHFNPRRLTSDELRDSILAATGELNLQAGGPSIYVPIAAEVLAGQSVPGAGWGKSSPEDQNRRSVYIHLKRSLLVPILSLYDQADTDSSCPVRYNTTVPTQSLGMLNGEFTNGKAAQLAERLRRESPNDLAAQVRRAIRLTTSRIAPDAEVAADVAFIRNLQTKRSLSDEQALKMFCLLALNTNEFLYVD